MRKCTKAEFFELKTRLGYFENVLLPKISAVVEKAASKGDLTENADFEAARELEQELEEEIDELRLVIKSSIKISASDIVETGRKVAFGSTVVLLNKATGRRQTWTIVSFMEENLGLGKLAADSDLALALLKKKMFRVIRINDEVLTIIEIIRPRHLFPKFRLSKQRRSPDGKKRF